MIEINNIETQVTKLLSRPIDDDQTIMRQDALVTLQDFTFLHKQTETKPLTDFITTANRFSQLAGICVYPQHLYLFKHHPARKVTVLNFPKGTANNMAVYSEFDAIVQVTKTDEIDYVFPYQAYQSGYQSFALEQCNTIIDWSKKAQLDIKIILETGAFESMQQVYELSRAVANLKPDFIKTSTGIGFAGATFEATYAICQSIVDAKVDCGIKVSGGIRDTVTAQKHRHIAESVMQKKATPDWFRIGASQILR